jgi:carbon-monoxide dehydrogenase medium subunit
VTAMQTFTYQKPATVAAASQAGTKDDTKFLAGGQSLLAAMKLRFAAPASLVDLAGIPELRGIRVEGNALAIGAMTRHAEVAASPEVKARIPALAALAAMIGDRQVRNMGTLGGSIANNDPASDYPAALLALNATITTSKRKIPADAFFKGLFETALEAGELITSVTFPFPKKAAYQKFKNAASRFALVGVFVALTDAGPRVAVTGAGRSGVFRVKAMEDALAKGWSGDALKAIAVPVSGLAGDLHASAEYRAHLIGVLAQRAVAGA